MIESAMIPEDVVAFFASDPAGPFSGVPRAARDPDSPVFTSLNSFLSTIPREEIARMLDDPYLNSLASSGEDPDREARILFAKRVLIREIARRRNEIVRTEVEVSRPTPYNLVALSDLEVDSEHLVPLSAFEFDGSRLLRNGHAFTILCTTGSSNSTYWLANAIWNEAKIADLTSVRLDPFLHGPRETFPSILYKMWIYGCPIDWNRLANLREPEHGSWRPGVLSTNRSEFTDFVWMPRNPEVHFTAEEVPTLEDVSSAAGRYLHAVYLPAQEVLAHFDGALRVYTETELQTRHHVHIRNAGKVGVREKVFRTNAPISRECFSALAQAFFVWNQDISDYFTSALAL